MTLRRILGNMLAAAGAQGVSMLVSFATALLVPKVLGVEEFGYWQLFLFYFGYAGAFQLGLNDGVYLIEGGKSRETIDRQKLSSQFLFGLLCQSLMSFVVIMATIAMQPENKRAFVIISCSILMPLYNSACFFQYLYQAIDETRIYSKSVVLDRGIMLALLIVLIVLKVDAFELYVYAFVFGKVIQLAYCLFHARGILVSEFMSLADAAKVSISSISVGIKLMIANLASTLILGMMRFVVDSCWGIEVFGHVSLALTMANFFLNFMTSTTMVLFPTLRKMDENELKKFFQSVQNALEIMLPIVMLAYLPIRFLLSTWLPAYADSFAYLGIIMPLCLFDGKMNTLYTTMFKVCRKEGELMKLNMAAMLMSAVLSIISGYIIHNLVGVLLSGTMAVICRSTVSTIVLSRDILGKGIVRYGELCLSVVFIAGFLFLAPTIATILFIVCYIIYLIVNRTGVLRLFHDFRSACMHLNYGGK